MRRAIKLLVILLAAVAIVTAERVAGLPEDVGWLLAFAVGIALGLA